MKTRKSSGRRAAPRPGKKTPARPAPSAGRPAPAALPGKIEHLVVLMMENRSFDHLLGYRPGVAGLTGKEFNLLDPSKPASATNPSFAVNNGAPWAVLAGQGPGHSLNAANVQLCNNKNGPTAANPPANNGFIANYQTELVYADHVKNATPEVIHVAMQSFPPSALPSINALADAFCVCDHWYSEVPGPTQPNRLYLHAATSFGYALNVWTQQFSGLTIYNQLQAAGLTWGTYQNDDNEVLEFTQVNQQTANFKPYAPGFAADVKSGALPNYSFIIPQFMAAKNGTPANSQHAPQDVRYGDNFIADVYETLRSNTALWNKTALVVIYDEHGGFYDHVVPPAGPNPDGLNSPPAGNKLSYAPVFDFDRLGFRVPAIIASPWVAAGRVDPTPYQHTSVMATARKLFGVKAGPLTKRDASANTFDQLFSGLAAPRTDTPATLPRAPLPAAPPLDSPAHPANQPLDPTQKDVLHRAFALTRSSQTDDTDMDSLPETQGEASEFIRRSYARHFGIGAKTAKPAKKNPAPKKIRPMKPIRNTILSSGALLGVATLLFAAACSNATGADAAQASAPALTKAAVVSPAGVGPALPVLSPSLPFDVTANPPFTLESLQTDFDVLSWQTFVAMNWPVLPNGQPNPAQRPGQNKDNATVWEMWRESSTIFLPGGAAPVPWGSPLPPSSILPPACRGLLKPGMHLLTQIGKTPGLLTEAVQPFNTGPLIDQNGRYARFEILVNQSMFNTIFNGKLYNKQAQQSVTSVVFDCGDQTAKQVGAIMVKAAWKILSPAEIAGGRFHTVQAVIYTPPSANPVIAEKCETATVGLVGLHVVHKTKDAPQWIWSTFEHVDNCPTNGEVADHPGYSFFNKNNPAAPLNTPPPRPWNPTNTEPPARRPQIERMIPIDAATRKLNASWQAALRAVNRASVWQYYELVSTQWPTAPAPGCDVATSAPANMSGAPAPQFLGNSTLESYIQGKVPNVSSSCIECHLNATTTTHTFSDFTYLLERAQ